MYILRSKIKQARSTGVAAQAYWEQRLFWSRAYNGYIKGTRKHLNVKKINNNKRIKITK
jgi:hypothetical protein